MEFFLFWLTNLNGIHCYKIYQWGRELPILDLSKFPYEQKVVNRFQNISIPHAHMRGIIFFRIPNSILYCAVWRAAKERALSRTRGEDVPKLYDVADDLFRDLLMNIDKVNFKTFVLDSIFGISSLGVWALTGFNFPNERMIAWQKHAIIVEIISNAKGNDVFFRGETSRFEIGVVRWSF